MTEMPITSPEDAYAAAVAEEVRAMMARRQVHGKQLAALLGVSQMYVSRRMHGEIPWDVADLARLAGLLRCKVADFLPSAPDATGGYWPTGTIAPVLSLADARFRRGERPARTA